MSDEFDDDIQQVPSRTPDFRTDLAEELARLAPEAVADGKIDVEKLRELLDADSADDGRERFGLMWPGKSRALKAAQAPTTATLLPDRETSKDWDTTHNVFIEGDNLEVLKILQKHYHGKIKMIYIDPPYNTGNDFIYPDNYKEGLQTYLEWTSQVSKDGKKLSSNPESAGRYHSNWLNMMYPRLKLARNLLSEDGIIFISIDDHEMDNLRKIGNEIFGEHNSISAAPTAMIWQRSSSTAGHISNAHEYILAYAKSKADLPLFRYRGGGTDSEIEHSALKRISKSNPESEIVLRAGTRYQGDNAVFTGTIGQSEQMKITGEMVFSNGSLAKDTKVSAGWAMKDQIERWMSGEETFDSKGQRVLEFFFNASGLLRYRKQRETVHPKTLLPSEVGSTKLASRELQELLQGDGFASYPKPVSLLRFLLSFVTQSDSLVLDFFSGSGTTAHAVMALNAEDGGSRRHIQVQLPEPVDPDSEAGKAGFGTIADIARERIRRAGEKIKEELAEQLSTRETPLDVGFRSYKLSDTSFVKWKETSNTERNALEERLAGLRGSADDDATPEMLLTELLLKQGYSLTENVYEIEIAGLNVWSVADGALLAIMDEHIKPSLDQLRAVVEAGPVRLVVLEDVFAGDDQLKTNLVQHAKTHAVELWSA